MSLTTKLIHWKNPQHYLRDFPENDIFRAKKININVINYLRDQENKGKQLKAIIKQENLLIKVIKESGRSGSACENESRQELTWKHKKIKGKKRHEKIHRTRHGEIEKLT